MTTVKNLGSKTTSNVKGLALHRQVFLERLRVQGYAVYTIQQYGQTIQQFNEEMKHRGVSVEDLAGPATESLLVVVQSKTPKNGRTFAAFCIRRFINYLIRVGVVPQPKLPEKEPTARERLSEEYGTYLHQQRGLSESTIYHCIRISERFMNFRFGEDTLGDLNAITPDDIVSFLLQFQVGSKPNRSKVAPSHLRNLFKFLFWSGKTKRNLDNGIPRVSHPKPINLPRYLKPEDVELLIEAVRTNDVIGRRNYAMLLLLARLGLRAPEVIAIQLDDINWRTGEVLVRGKGKLHDRMPITVDIGDALVNYIRNGRAGTSRTLFVSSITPHRPFKDAQILNYILKKAFEKTGLKPPQKYIGSHLLRHSLATNMLRNGASLEEIGTVLRHRSRMTTTIYAKHDIDALRSITRTWPQEGGAQ